MCGFIYTSYITQPQTLHYILFLHQRINNINDKRDFLLAGGFGEMLGNDVTKLQRAIQPCSNLLEVTRKSSMLVMHTREGHHKHMKDVHDHKQRKGEVIGSDGPMGKILLRGEPGHDIIPELYPLPNEPIIDKPGKVCGM